jgi:hypothetical protein
MSDNKKNETTLTNSSLIAQVCKFYILGIFTGCVISSANLEVQCYILGAYILIVAVEIYLSSRESKKREAEKLINEFPETTTP